MHTVVVGGGFAGVKAAREISKQGLGKVTLISDEPYFLHHDTLYATATGRSKAESIVPLHEIFMHDDNVEFVIARLTSIDPDRKLAICGKKHYKYDKLILALGTVTTFFDIKGMAKHAYGVKSLDEVEKFHDHIMHEVVKDHHLDKNYVIVGAGPTGVELAGALHEHLEELSEEYHLKKAKIRITLVEAADRILPKLSKTADKRVRARLKEMGVKVITNHKVEALNKQYITVDGRRIPTETVIWTSGMSNNPFFGEHKHYFDLDHSGRVNVNQYLEAYRDIYVVGDSNSVKYSGMGWPAVRQAKFLARHFRRLQDKKPLRVFRSVAPPCATPIGSKYGYVEWLGMYVDGRLGLMTRRMIELIGYLEILPRKRAWAAWRAHNIPEIDRNL